MPRFYVSVKLVKNEVLEYYDIEAEDSSQAREIAMDRAENECRFIEDDINIIDIEKLSEDEASES